VEQRYVESDGVRVHCVSAGAGPLVLLLHGFPECWYQWRDYLTELGRDRLAVAPDLRGYNLSDKPASIEAYRLPRLLADVDALADVFSPGTPFVLVGHDWGGYIAWSYAAAYPHRLSRLVVVNAPHPGVFATLLRSDPDQQRASAYIPELCHPGAEERLARDGYAPLWRMVFDRPAAAVPESDREMYRAAWTRPGALTGALNYYRANAFDGDVASGTGVIAVRTHVIWGERDTALVSRNVDGLASWVPELSLCRVAAASHWVVREQPELVTAEIRRFLNIS
jgi:pimeloyl-ACP methyl ester carboxylesterase